MLFTISGTINHKRVREFSEFIDNLMGPRDNDIQVLINSHGGDEGCGRALAGMISNLRDHGYNVNTIGQGDIQSAAVLVFAAGNKRSLSRFASVMVHESSSSIEGNASGMKRQAKQMEADEKFWCDLLQTLTGTDAKVWQKLHEDESYLRPEEALKLNLATELI